MKKEIEMCDWCEESEAEYKIKKGNSKGDVLCENCFDDWSDRELEDKYEELE